MKYIGSYLFWVSIIFASTQAEYDNYNNDNELNELGTEILGIEGVDFATWCTTSVPEQKKCEQLMLRTMADVDFFSRDFVQLKCKRAFDTEQCMTWVDNGEASLLSLDAGEVFVAGRFHSLVPILQEMYAPNEAFLYSVAVTRRGALPQVYAGAGLRGLRGAKACFPSVGALAGWDMPIYVLMQEGGLKVTDCNNHVKSAIEFFGESCAPNSLKDMYNPIGDNSDKLCKLCTGGAGVRCTLADPFAGYEGALRCLIHNGTGDVAFVRHTTVQHVLLSRRIFGGITEDQFELICRDGSRAPLREWARCHWGRAPADAIVTSSAANTQQRQRYVKFFQKLVQLYGAPNPNNRQYNQNNQTGDGRTQNGYPFLSTENPRYPYSSTERQQYPYDNNWRQNRPKEQEQEFEELPNDKDKMVTLTPYDTRQDNGQRYEQFHLFVSNGTTDLLVQDATYTFRVFREHEQSASFLMSDPKAGPDAQQAASGVRSCPVGRATLCLPSEPEMEKCIRMRAALRAAFLSPTLTCWRGGSARRCVRCVADGACDFAVLDAADMLNAAQHHRLVPFMQEVYSSGNTWYYAVAVAKEQDPDTDLTYLREKNTCHTGIGMAAGWIYPLAYLISNGWMRSYRCDGAHAAAQYFTKSCAPGALSGEFVDRGSVPHDNLCHLCHGAAFRRCRRDASEPYYGHIGALRCMVEGGGDVAFVRHTAPGEASGGRRKEWWARDLLPDDLQLLCTDGTRAKMHEYARCNLGKVPGSVLVGRPNHTELDTFANLMVYAQQFYGAATTDEFSFSMFHSPAPYSDLIFSDAAVRLKTIPKHKRSADVIAGPALLRAARLVSCDAPQFAYYVAADSDFLSHAYRVGYVGYIVAMCLFLVALWR